MDAISRRSALAAAATLGLVACSEAEPDEVGADVEGAGDPPEALAKLAAWEEENRAVTAWVEEHRSALPTDYDELARLPSAYRLGVFLALPPANASALMQERLRRSVAARPEMTEAQRALIAEAREVFTVAWYAGQHDNRVAVWQGPFGQRVDALFSHADEGLRRRIANAVGGRPRRLRVGVREAGYRTLFRRGAGAARRAPGQDGSIVRDRRRRRRLVRRHPRGAAARLGGGSSRAGGVALTQFRQGVSPVISVARRCVRASCLRFSRRSRPPSRVPGEGAVAKVCPP